VPNPGGETEGMEWTDYLNPASLEVLRECKLEGSGSGYKVELDDLFRDWAGIARDLKKIPTIAEYERVSQYSVRPLITRFGSWTQAPHGLKQYAEEQGWTEEWKEVLEIIEAQGEDRRGRARMSAVVQGQDNTGGARRSAAEAGSDNAQQGPDYVRRRRAERPAYGPLMRPCPLICGPVNEMGVVYLFGAMAEKLGFVVLRIQTEFPDCEALKMIDEDRCQLVKIEFEHQSRNFLKHMHKVDGCDLLVCWKHNWPECPLEVVELRELLPKLLMQNHTADLRRMNADQEEIAKIASIPPQQARTGLAGDPGLPKIAEIEEQNH
ncbi:MAG: homing endonuclease associated repeat-containing protein, partial [Candidatus Angelobacter sp.]